MSRTRIAPVTKPKKKSLYRSVYQALRGKILSAEYEPGEQIETEPQLAKQYGASLITIRQAAQLLADEGLLVKQQGRGTFVAKSVSRRLTVLGVFGLNLKKGTSHLISTYFTDLLAFSQVEASSRSLGFQTLWLPSFMPEWATAYLEETKLREFTGFLFYGCSDQHVILKRVRELNLRYVMITAGAKPHNAVWLDYQQATSQALGVFDWNNRRPILVMGLDSQFVNAGDLFADAARFRLVRFPSAANMIEYETLGYERAGELIAAGTDFSRVLWLDDILARGATRAMLRAGIGRQSAEYVVICGKQEITPLGLPVTYVVHDTCEDVRQAFEMLEAQRREKTQRTPSYRSGFSVLEQMTTAIGAK